MSFDELSRAARVASPLNGCGRACGCVGFVGSGAVRVGVGPPSQARSPHGAQLPLPEAAAGGGPSGYSWPSQAEPPGGLWLQPEAGQPASIAQGSLQLCAALRTWP